MQLNDRVVRAYASEAVDTSLMLSRVKPMSFKLLPCLPLSLKGSVWRASRQVYLCLWERKRHLVLKDTRIPLKETRKRHLAGFPHLGVVDRWPATSERARYSALVAFSR